MGDGIERVTGEAQVAESRIEVDSALWNKLFYSLLALVTAWRLIYAAMAPLELAADEAYYWDWSRALDWCYYSKPPMVAWLIALSTRALGATELTVRLPAVVLGSVGMWALFLLARRLFGSRTAVWTVAAAAASPGSATLGLVMTTDAPLVCFWCLAQYGLWRAIENHEDNLFWWTLTAVFTGLGILSKPMMLAFPALAILFLFFAPRERKTLGMGRPVVFSLCSLWGLIPLFWWNAWHGWVTLHHSRQHFEAAHGSILKFLGLPFEFIGSQLLVVSPFTFLLLAVAFVCCMRRRNEQDSRLRYLLVFSALPLAIFLVMSCRQRIIPNWPAVYYPAAMAVLAAWALGDAPCGNRVPNRRKLFEWGVAFGVALTLLAYALPFVAERLGPEGNKLVFLRKLRGWDELGGEVGAVLAGLPNKDKTFLIADGRQVVSELAFYTPGQPRVYDWNGKPGVVRSQYDIWPGPSDKTGWDALVVVRSGAAVSESLKAAFHSMDLYKEIRVRSERVGDRRYDVYWAHEMQPR
ncbi:MAG: ArnT family glycosyltransferase [Syntrophobacteraceae bacterium]